MRPLALVLLLAVDGLLAAALLAEPPAAWLHPVPPPLTRLDALGDLPLAAGSPAPPDALRRGVELLVDRHGDPAQRAALAELRAAAAPLRADQAESARLRAAVAADAARLAEALGPARLAAVVAAREALGRELGEGTVWAELARRSGR